MSLILAEMRRTYAAQRGVSQGASVTLASVSGGFQARFDCATRCAAVLGTRNHDGTTLFVPMEDAHKSLSRLAETLSVALVDTVTDEIGTRFVLVWRITQTRPVLVVAPTASDNVDDY